MSKVFSAKRKTVEFEYEFIDGTTSSITARSLSSKEQEEVSSAEVKSTKDVIEKFRETLKKQLTGNDSKVIKRVVDEQYEDGDLIEFSNSLSVLIQEEKAKK